MPLTYQPAQLPTQPSVVQGLVARELAWVRANIPQRGEMGIEEVQHFVRTAPAPHEPGGQDRGPRMLPPEGFSRRALDFKRF